jgi:hypothetical protein
MYYKIIIARRGCKTKRACVRGDKKVFYREKDIQELMCYFFFFTAVVVIQNSHGGIHDEAT